MKRKFLMLSVGFWASLRAVQAQIKIPDLDLENFSLDQLLGKVLIVKQGWAPQFFSGKKRIPRLQIVRDLLATRKNSEINRLFNIFRTGRTIYRITNYAGAAISIYGAVKQIARNSDSTLNNAKGWIYAGLSSVSAGTIVKLLTKGASYKAVDMFGGMIKKKIKDIISLDVMPSQNYLGGMEGKVVLTVKW
ncbi:MAG: hypothetical protein N2747_03260 [Chitinophagaceae bacterium]|nr:hypothetical protein [Chitinophagaceae bacterium]